MYVAGAVVVTKRSPVASQLVITMPAQAPQNQAASDPSNVDGSAAAHRVIMLAKAPVAGRVKTRLGLAGDVAAALARAFIEDTWRALGACHVERELAYDGDARALPALDGCVRWAQPAGDLGARIEAALARGTIVVGTDAPGLPTALIRAASAALDTHDAVIGPACDGGFVLLGTRRCPARLLADLRWSQPDTGRLTRQRLEARGYRVALLPTWFDVDQPADLARLRAVIAAGWICAPATARALEAVP